MITTRGPPLPPPVSLESPRLGASVSNTAHSRRSMQSPRGSQRVKKQSKWSAEEDAIIIGLRGAGMKWEDVSKRLPGRSAISCRLHYQNYLERRSEWDEERKNKLARLYERFKPDMWSKVAEELAVPWRAAEAMHWALGEADMARRAGVIPFALAAVNLESGPRAAPTTPRASFQFQTHEPMSRNITPPSPRSMHSSRHHSVSSMPGQPPSRVGTTEVQQKRHNQQNHQQQSHPQKQNHHQQNHQEQNHHYQQNHHQQNHHQQNHHQQNHHQQIHHQQVQVHHHHQQQNHQHENHLHQRHHQHQHQHQNQQYQRQEHQQSQPQPPSRYPPPPPSQGGSGLTTHESLTEHGDFFYTAASGGRDLAPIQLREQPRNPGPLPSLAELTTGVSPYSSAIDRPPSRNTNRSTWSLQLSPGYQQHVDITSTKRRSLDVLQREGSLRRRLG
ncbi:related to DRPLA protein [Claviceps purpurea 20.1]|uniref:Related to DRPLA protein n=1 Tax=Claviceps purpurea (strain 20.1) TaxID=1111077 RepID=M1WGD8_CLAP2|nr:related to DRPLA protein [Claviceps purpurea 20.1]